jgi:hypothetical protein
VDCGLIPQNFRGSLRNVHDERVLTNLGSLITHGWHRFNSAGDEPVWHQDRRITDLRSGFKRGRRVIWRSNLIRWCRDQRPRFPQPEAVYLLSNRNYWLGSNGRGPSSPSDRAHNGEPVPSGGAMVGPQPEYQWGTAARIRWFQNNEKAITEGSEGTSLGIRQQSTPPMVMGEFVAFCPHRWGNPLDSWPNWFRSGANLTL